MSGDIISKSYLQELLAEKESTRKCLERIPESLFPFKPHPKSMTMEYLAMLVAQIPRWIHSMVHEPEIDLKNNAGYEDVGNNLVHIFDQNFELAVKALSNCTDADLDESFTLKSGEEILYTTTKRIDIRTSLNHWVHHRGQLTVYMRMNDIEVPSIYGPSADDPTFSAPK